MLFIIIILALLYFIPKTNINKEMIFFSIAFYFLCTFYQTTRYEGLGLIDTIIDGAEELYDDVSAGGEQVLCLASHEAALTTDPINMIPLYPATDNCKILRYNFDKQWLSDNSECIPYINSEADCADCEYIEDEGICKPNFIQYYEDAVTNCASIKNQQDCVDRTEKDGDDNEIMNICDWRNIDEEDKCIYKLDPPNEYISALCESSIISPVCSSLSEADCGENQFCEYNEDICDSITQTSTMMKNICEGADLSSVDQEIDKTCSYKLNCLDNGEEEHICLYDYFGIETLGNDYIDGSDSPCSQDEADEAEADEAEADEADEAEADEADEADG